MQKFEFTGTDEFTGNAFAFNLQNVSIDDGMVLAELQTEAGTVRIAEHINDGEKVERTDSNMRINEIDDIAALFPCERPSLAPVADYVPLRSIWDALEQKLRAV